MTLPWLRVLFIPLLFNLAFLFPNFGLGWRSSLYLPYRDSSSLQYNLLYASVRTAFYDAISRRKWKSNNVAL